MYQVHKRERVAPLAIFLLLIPVAPQQIMSPSFLLHFPTPRAPTFPSPFAKRLLRSVHHSMPSRLIEFLSATAKFCDLQPRTPQALKRPFDR